MDKLISGATLELESLRNQSAVLRLKNKRALELLQEKAARQENELKQKLEKQRKAIQAEIDALESQKGKLIVENNAISTQVTDREITKQVLEGDVSDLRTVKDTLEQTITELKRQITETTAEINSNKSVLEELIRDVADLQNQKLDIEKHIEAISGERMTIEAKIAEVTKEYELKTNDYTKKILDIDAQLMRKIAMLKEVSKKDQAMREELANQRVALEKREEVIRRRELIVQTGEQKLKDNVSMLQL